LNSKKFTISILSIFQNCWESSGLSFQEKNQYPKTMLQNKPDEKTAATNSATINTNHILQLTLSQESMSLGNEGLYLIFLSSQARTLNHHAY
jgi:hypothetical protein